VVCFLNPCTLIPSLLSGLLVPILSLPIVLVLDMFAVLVELAILLQVSRFATLATLGFPLVAALIYGVVGYFAVLAEQAIQGVLWTCAQR
jgi:hypothetical protein